MPTIAGLFKIILTGDKEVSRKSAREVRKLLHSSGDSGKYDDIKRIVENAPEEYANIKEEWRKENFVVAVSVLYFLHGKESDPDFLFPWIFELFLHQNGNIRYAALRMLENELGPLTVHIRCPGNEYGKRLVPGQADFILLNLFSSLHQLAIDSWKPVYRRYKYISSLPTGSYKTVQMALSTMEEDCGKEYFNLS